MGYAALIGAFDLKAPLPRSLSAIGERHAFVEKDGWRVRSPRYSPAESLEGHLTFALKHEGLDLAVLKQLFAATGPGPIGDLVKARPTGAYARRTWFLYEWLTGTRVDLPNADRGAYVPVVDPDRQFALPGQTSPRHRVRNNLPGTPGFCPLVFRTEALERFVAMDLQARARKSVATIPPELLARAAAFLQFKDSKSSYAIEGEHPAPRHIQAWGRAIYQAGRRPIDLDQLVRLQRMVIIDPRFDLVGLRTEGVFVGNRDLSTREPIPDHVGARPDDLKRLIEGLTAFDREAAPLLDPVVAASILAFGFVYIHPFLDGNGRLHRYLMHHSLARRSFTPEGIPFPVSAVLLDRIGEYSTALEDYSRRLLPLVDWEPTESGNVRVLNDTADYYRFFDATPQAEFLYDCVRRAVDLDLPREAEHLQQHDAFSDRLKRIVKMPEPHSNLLFQLLHQNGGILSDRKRKGRFSALSDEEVERIQSAYRESFVRTDSLRSPR